MNEVAEGREPTDGVGEVLQSCRADTRICR